MKYNALITFISSYSKVIDKRELTLFLSLMKGYQLLSNLSFSDLDFTVLIEMVKNESKENLIDKIKILNTISNNDKDKIFSIIYTPKKEIKFQELIGIFDIFEGYPKNSIFNKILNYLFVKGIAFNDEEKCILQKMIFNGSLLVELKKYRKEIVIMKENINNSNGDDSNLIVSEMSIKENSKNLKNNNSGFEIIENKEIKSK